MSEDMQIYVLKCPKKCGKFIKKTTKFWYRYVDKSTGKIDIVKLMDTIIDRFKPKVNQYYARHVKYTQIDIINGIVDILDNSTYWSRYKGTVPGEYLRKKHRQYESWGIYACLYKIILEIYFKKNKYEKLKNQSIDSTFIRNLYGVEMIQRNPTYKSKNGIKVSTIDDCNGVATSIAIARGAKYDANIAIEQINHSFIDNDPKTVVNNNRYAQVIRGDSHYGSKKLRQALERKGYNVITDINVGNTKDKEKLKNIYRAKKKYKKSCGKRSIKEISFAWLHKYPKLDRFVEKKVSSYAVLLLLAYAITTIGKIV